MWKKRDGYALEEWYRLELHHWILMDSIRDSLFRQAIDEVVNEGDIALDVGAGLGYQSMQIAKAGAKKVYGIEYHKNVLKEAEKIMEVEGLQNKIEFINGYSLDVPSNAIKPVDVIVSETLGFMGIGENIVKYVADARNKWLKPNGKVIPFEVELYLAAGHYPGIAQGECKQVMCDILPEYLVTDAKRLAKFNLYSDDIVDIDKCLKFRADTMVNGLIGWFRARLTENIILDTSPFSETTCWHQIFYPINEVKGEFEVQIDSYEKGDLILLDCRRVSS